MKASPRLRRLTLFAVLTGLAGGHPAAAFDTGPHATMTIAALEMAGFQAPAAGVAQVTNWLVDYYTGSPTRPTGSQCDLEKLHFDGVFTAADVEAYWATFTANAQAALDQRYQANDALGYLTVLGMTLHVVQDFYAHSNWVGLHVPPVGFNTKTWFQESPPNPNVHSGWYPNCVSPNQPPGTQPHGGYTSGLNKDSVVRPNYDRAYVLALAASVEWAKNALARIGGANSAFATQVRTYQPAAQALAADQNAALYISEWVDKPGDPNVDGHWNGPRSGYLAAFTAFTARWVASTNSPWVARFKSGAYYAALAQNLYTQTTGAPAPVTPQPLSGTVFGMRTLSVYARSAITGTDSYYGTLAAPDVTGALVYRDASQYHLPRTDVPWLQLIFLENPPANLSLRYRLWNEYGTTNNDPVPIKDTKTELVFQCSTGATVTCTGDVAGGPWTEAQPYVTEGDDGKFFGNTGVKVEFYFATDRAAPQ